MVVFLEIGGENMSRDNADKNTFISTVLGWTVDAVLYLPRIFINFVKAVF